MSFSWLETATFIARSPSRVARQFSNVSTVRPRVPMLTINQILGLHSVQSETTLWWRTLCLISKKVGEKKEKESFYYIYTYYYIYFLRPNRWHVLLSKFSQCRWPLGLESYSASPLADVSYFLCFTNVFLNACLRWYSSHTRRQAFSCCLSYGCRTGSSQSYAMRLWKIRSPWKIYFYT